MNPNYKPHTTKGFIWTVSFSHHTTPWGRQHNYLYSIDEETKVESKGLVKISLWVNSIAIIDATIEEKERKKERDRDWNLDGGKKNKWMDTDHSPHPLPNSHSGRKQFPCQLLLHSFLCFPIGDFNNNNKRIKIILLYK